MPSCLIHPRGCACRHSSASAWPPRLGLPRVLGRSIRTTAVKRVCRGYFPLIHIVFSAPLASRFLLSPETVLRLSRCVAAIVARLVTRRSHTVVVRRPPVVGYAATASSAPSRHPPRRPSSSPSPSPRRRFRAPVAPSRPPAASAVPAPPASVCLIYRRLVRSSVRRRRRRARRPDAPAAISASCPAAPAPAPHLRRRSVCLSVCLFKVQLYSPIREISPPTRRAGTTCW